MKYMFYTLAGVLIFTKLYFFIYDYNTSHIMTTIHSNHFKLGSHIGTNNEGKDIYMGVSSERDDNNSETTFTPQDQGLQKLVKVYIEPSQANVIEECDDMYLKFNYENTHATSAVKIFSFWRLVSTITIKENNETVLENTCDTVDGVVN